MDRYNGKLCRPRKEMFYTMDIGFNSMLVALRPTQRWIIQGRDMHKWWIKRHNVVLVLTDDEFIRLFYRTDH